VKSPRALRLALRRTALDRRDAEHAEGAQNTSQPTFAGELLTRRIWRLVALKTDS